METGKEKRLSSRVQLKSPLRYRMIPVDATGFRNADVQDISLTGFRFHSREFIPRRASIILEMDLLGHAPVHSLARAVWVREIPSEGGYEVGGMFVEPPHGARTTLSRLAGRKGLQQNTR
jgi:hypothetical protein